MGLWDPYNRSLYWVAVKGFKLSYYIGETLLFTTPKVCKIMAFMAIILGLGLFFYILLGFRYRSYKVTVAWFRVWVEGLGVRI